MVDLKVAHFVRCISLDLAPDEKVFVCCVQSSLDYLQQVTVHYGVDSVRDVQQRDHYYEK